jgi:FMN reductase (NADPH)
LVNNETLKLMHKHGSVRRYKSDPVAVEMVETIVRAGQRASTSSNLQMYSVVAVTDEARREQMATYCGNQDFIRQAPVFLTWCADLSRLQRVAAARGYQQVSRYAENFLLAAVDVSIMMQNAALAAESLGLGICYVGAIRNHPQDVIEMLKLPRLVFPISGMAVGWPEKQPLIRPRLPLEAVLHWESYSTEGEQRHWAAYDEAMMATGIYEGRQVGAAEGEEVEAYGWTEHSARRVSQAKRTELKQVLEQQGFLIE